MKHTPRKRGGFHKTADVCFTATQRESHFENYC